MQTNPYTFLQTVTTNSAVTVDAAKYSTFVFTLQANVTALTVNNAVAGAIYTFVFVQDATGGRTFTWPSPVKWTDSAATISAANGRITVQFLWDGTTWNEVNHSGPGSGYSPSNPPPYPVTSVAGRTGAITLTAADVGASEFPVGAFAFRGTTNTDTLSIHNTSDNTYVRFRPKAGGGFDVVNNAATVAIMQVTDAGNMLLTGTLTVSGAASLNGGLSITGSLTGNAAATFGGVVTSGTGGNGSATTHAGDATHTGYFEFIAANGTRQGYIGYTTTTAASDQGTINYQAGAHYFNAPVTIQAQSAGATVVQATPARANDAPIKLIPDGDNTNNGAGLQIRAYGHSGGTDVYNLIENWGGNFYWQVGSSTGPVTIASLGAGGAFNTAGNLTENGVRVYSASNPPPYPVTSVAGRTGAVTLTAADVAAGTFPAGTFAFAGPVTIGGPNVTGGLKHAVGGSATAAAATYPTSGGITRVHATNTNVVLDVGMLNASPWSVWLQTGDMTGSTTYPLNLNPLGGAVNTGGTLSENGNRVYSAGNPPPYPVTSVAGRTGAVTLGAADVAAGTFPAGRFAFNGELDLTATNAVTAAATGTGVGDKISLYAGLYGFGIQSSRLVAYIDAGASFAVRQVAASGQKSSGTEVFIAQSNGNVSATGSIDPALGMRNRYVVRMVNNNTAPGMGSGATITSGVVNVINWSFIESTSGASATSMWTSANPSRFYAPVAGFYMLTWSGWFTNATSCRLIQRIRKNGTSDIWEFDTYVPSGTGACGGGGGSCMTYLAANDYVELIYTPQDANLAYNTGNYANPRLTMALVGVA